MMLFGGLNIRSSEEKGMGLLVEVEEFVVNFILPIVLLLATFAIFAFYVVPAHKKLPTLKDNLDSLQKDVNVLQLKVSQLKNLEENKELLVSDLIKLSWALEERDKVPELTEQVRRMSADSSAIFRSLDYTNTNSSQIVSSASQANQANKEDTEVNPNLYREEKVDVDIDVKDFASAIVFLKSAESSIRLFRVESLRLASQGNFVRANLVMASPYLNPAFTNYSQTAVPIDLNNSGYRTFMERLDTFKNYAKDIDASLPNF